MNVSGLNLRVRSNPIRFGLRFGDSDDLMGITSTIQTELRFASLESDMEMRMMIKDRFGIPLAQF